jgi:hypothetical protein
MREPSNPTTRLSQRAKNTSLNELEGLLNNVVRFVECPVKDREVLLNLWNSRFPREYVEAGALLKKYNIRRPLPSTSGVRMGIETSGKLYSVLIKVMEHTYGYDAEDNFLRLIEGIKKDIAPQNIRCACPPNSTSWDTFGEALPMSEAYLACHLGPQFEDFLVWVKNSAVLYDDLITAKHTLHELFGMAKTAGQIKRMVPELMQYLPAAQRLAFEDQKRSSAVPFEWAPYPKDRIEVMLAAVNKGHLLTGMAKSGQEGWVVSDLDSITWSRHATWVT